MADMFLEMARLCDLSTIETGYQKDPPAGTTTTTKKKNKRECGLQTSHHAIPE